MRIFTALVFLLITSTTLAAMFPLPRAGNDIIGQVQTAIAQSGDNFATIAERYNVTFAGLMEANPNINPQKPAPGTVLIIPSAYVLPNAPRKGIIINLAELRLYYFPKGQKIVYTYPVGIGIEGWNIQPGQFKIVEKQKDPTWYIPPAVHEELKEKGFDLPNSIPPGPDNPLGKYMMRLSQWTYLIHGCVDPSTIGRRSSSGCFRMYPENIEQLFAMVPVGTPVRVIDDPYKIGWQNGQLFMEAHLPLQEQQMVSNGDMSPVVNAINEVIGNKSANIQWDRAFALAKQSTGVPEQIGAIG